MFDSGDLYGRSLKFPPQVGANGQLLWSEGEENVRESLSILLQTRPGERGMLPEFGCNLEQFLFEPNTLGTLTLIQREVSRAVSEWEPRVQVDDILVESHLRNSRSMVDITLFYTLIATQTSESLRLTLALQA